MRSGRTVSVAASQPPANPDLRPLVLAVDDQSEVRRFIAGALSDAYRIEEAADGREGLRKALERRPDLILSDLIMPLMPGDELLRAVRAHPELDRTPFVILTANDDRELRVLLLRRGAQDYLTKPFPADELRVRVRNQIALKAALESEIRRAEDLRQSEERFRLLVERVEDYAIIGLDPQGRVTSWNVGAQRIKGYRTDEILGREFTCFYPPEDVDAGKPHRLLQKARAEGGATDEGWRVRKNGSRFWADVSVTALRDVEGNLRGFAKVTRDMTERKRVLEERERIMAQLLQGQKLQAVGQLAAGIAHEINNPIGWILSNLGVIGEYLEDLQPLILSPQAPPRPDGTPDPGALLKDFRAALQDCRGGAERIRDIVRNLREFSHVDEKTLRPSDLGAVVEGSIRLCWNELKYKATLHRDYGPLPIVLCYPQQIEQVLVNLLVNAAQAIPERGDIYVRTWAENGDAAVEIRDTGGGIAPEHLSKLFEPFFTTKPVGTGTGLGLHVAHKIVEAHEGRITVASEAGRGTQVIVRLPIQGPRRTRG
jgi:PAS domain S-box-containing protein